MAKKFTAILIALVLTFGVLPLSIGATPQINYGSSEANDTDILFAAGILDRESFNGEKEVTRGDFIYAAVKLYNLDELVLGNKEFTDVNSNDYRKNAISFAADRGIISGYGDGSFHPDDVLLKEQAAKIIVSLLGYDVHANAYGGYPGGYLSVATVLGLFKGVKVGDYAQCTWQSAAKMLYNALDIEILQSTNDEYKTVDGETPLTKWLRIYKEEGKVLANSLKLGKDKVQIDDEIYIDKTETAEGMLGFPVKAYYEYNIADEREIIQINKVFDEEYIISAEDIDKETTAEKIVYEDEKGSKNLPVEKGVFFIRNFTKQDISAEKLNIDSGYMVATDTNCNGKIDVIAVYNTTTYVIDEINKTSYVIKDLYDAPDLKLDFNDNRIDISISGYGGAKTFADLKENDVLTVTKSDDGKYIDIAVSSVKIKGEVLEKNDTEVKIGDKYYQTLKTATKAFNEIEPGKVATVYLDKNGFVAGARVSNLSSKEYGFLIAVKADDDSSLKAPSALIRLFKMDGEIKTYETADEIYVNGDIFTPEGGKWDGKKIENLLTDGGAVVNQLICYGIDENNKIFKLDTAVDNTENVGGEENKFSLDFDFPDKNDGNTTLTSLVYNDAGGGSLSHQIGLNGSYVISVPTLEAGEQMIDREREIRFVTHKVEYLGKRIEKVKAYDLDESLNAAVVIVPSTLSSAGGEIPDQPFVIVDKVVEAIAYDGLPEQVMYAWCQGKYEKYYFNEEISAEDKKLQKGDVIRIVNSSSGIKKVTKIFTFKGTKGERVTAGDGTGYVITSGFAMDKNSYDDWLMEKYNAAYNKIYRMNKEPQWEQLNIALHCKPVKVSGYSVVISTGKEGVDNKVIFFDSKASVVKYDEMTDTISKASFTDINPDDASQSLLVRINYSSGGEIYIIDRRDDAEIPWGGYENYGAGR